MWLMKAALEKAGKADRLAVAQAFRTMDGGPSKYYPGGEAEVRRKGPPGRCRRRHRAVGNRACPSPSIRPSWRSPSRSGRRGRSRKDLIDAER